MGRSQLRKRYLSVGGLSVLVWEHRHSASASGSHFQHSNWVILRHFLFSLPVFHCDRIQLPCVCTWLGLNSDSQTLGLGHQLLDLTMRVSESSGYRWSPRIGTLTNSPASKMRSLLLLQGPHFENYCSTYRKGRNGSFIMVTIGVVPG